MSVADVVLDQELYEGFTHAIAWNPCETLCDGNYPCVHFRDEETEALCLDAEAPSQGCLCPAGWPLRTPFPATSVLRELVVKAKVGCMSQGVGIITFTASQIKLLSPSPTLYLNRLGLPHIPTFFPPCDTQDQVTESIRNAITNLSLLFAPQQSPAVPEHCRELQKQGAAASRCPSA